MFRAGPVSWAACILVLLLHGGYALHGGPALSWDSHAFSSWADGLLASGFNYGAYLEGSRLAVLPRILYLGFVSLVALAKLVAGEDWPWLIVGFNVLCSGAVALLVCRFASRLSGGLAGAIAGLLYLGGLEIAWWARYAVSDVSFILVSFGAWLAFALAFLSWRRGLWLVALGAVLLAASYRPPGVVMLPVVGLGFLLWLRMRGIGIPTNVFRARLGAAALLIACLAVAATVMLVRDPSRWPFLAFSRAVESQAERYGRGEVVGGRPEIAQRAPREVHEYVVLIGRRVANFFRFTFPGYSRTHQAANAAFFLPLYLGAIAGIARLVVARAAPTPEEKLLALSVALIALFALFHSVTHLDSALRYRFPMIPHFILLSAHGWSGLIARGRRWARPA